MEDEAFAEHIIATADVQLCIPAFMSFQDAATLGMGVVTCGQGLFQHMGLTVSEDSHSKGETFSCMLGFQIQGA